MLLLRSIEWKPGADRPAAFPFSVPVIRDFTKMAFDTPLTFLVGENGSGKSTLIEALALAAELPAVGSEELRRDPTLAHLRPLADSLRLVWNKRTRKGFFMRAEDFFGYARRMNELRAEMEAESRRADQEARGRSASALAQNLARLPYESSLGEMRRSYGDGLDANSHGEGFLKLFQRRFVGEGLYLLDEPEAPLSPTRQLTLLSLFHHAIDQGAQMIVATHSPILMAYPGATLLNLDNGHIEAVRYESLEHVQVTRSFLADPARYFQTLFADDESDL